MKISTMSAAAQAPLNQEAPKLNVRSLKMNTNATPGVITPEVPEEPLTISDNVDKAEGTVEATQPLSPQMAAIAKAKRALQQERQAFEREKADFQSAKEGQPSGGIDPAQLKSNPLRVLLENGVTYDQLTEAILENQNSGGAELQALKDEIKSLKDGFDQKLSDKDKQAEAAVLAEMRKEAVALASEGDTYELVRETGSIPQVMELIEKTYRQSGEVLEVSEAMQLVEDELIAESLKLANLKKVQGKLQPETPIAPIAPQQRPRTLTNRDTAVAPMDRKTRALLAFRGQLPKQ